MFRQFYRNGAQMPFSGNSAFPHPLVVRFQFKPFGSRLSYSFRRPAHQQAHPSGFSPDTVRRLAIWPFIGVNILVFLKWQQAKIDALEKTRDKQTIGDRNATHAPTLPPLMRNDRIRYMMENYTLNLKSIQERRWHTLLTAAVSHESFPHLLFNMVSFNALVGYAVLIRFPLPTLFYLGVGSGLASDIASLYDWHRKGQQERYGLGASGVISGIGTALACTRPWASFGFMFIPVPIPLWALMAGYIAYDSYRLNSEGSTIGHAAHLGGSGFGVLFYVVFLRRYGGVINYWRAYSSRFLKR
ncbi:hypothetical protein DL769_006575 [Monosporascus sp. CRB-8-3]|nr:hypothetical protein DL769_006575 [Monosporascus sp. CRB-8-3]